MTPSNEQTLKSILSALWNVSAHCVENKAAICAVPGALEFLVGLLEYRSPSKSLAVVENAGGILRNMSSFVAVHEDHRRTLRRTGVYQVLLRQLGSASLTVVSNACGSLWNLSARCAEDQQRLRDLGAIGLLRSLVNSKHKMIAMGSTAALKNLLVPRSAAGAVPSESRPFDKTASPGLHARRQRSLDRDFERHSDIGDFPGPPRQSLGITAQHSNGWVMSSSAGGNLFPTGGTVRAAMTDQVEESNWRRLMDPANVKVSNAGAVPGSSSFTHGVDRTFYDSQSVDNSPAVHRRVPMHGISAAVSSSLDYGHPVRNQMGAAYNGWSGGEMAVPNGYSDVGFDHLSRRMERVHFTDLPDCSQDEPINFSMKYKESTDASNLPAVQRSSSSAAVADGSGLLTTRQSVLNSPMSRFHVSRQSLPNGHSHHLDRTRSQQMAMSQAAAGGYSKPQFSSPAGIQFDAYGRLSMDAERPTNYSLQYAERYEDDDCSSGQFSEQPIDYSTRYMEPQSCRPAVCRQDRDEHSGLYADTVKTFCTEGTPMNYQSTATSMTDLSNTKTSKNAEFQPHRRTHSSDDLDVDEVQDFSRKYSEAQMEENEGHSSAGHRAYSWPQQRVEVSAFSHRDGVTIETGISSPTEQPQQYCTEGTPPNISHSGSLNSLSSGRAAKANNDSIQSDYQRSSVLPVNSRPNATTASLLFNKPAEKFPSGPAVGDSNGMGSISGKSEGSDGGTAETKDAAHGKTVTFDVESNQVEQTPLMFSRSSSLGSLSSFDVRSVHSSVVSEYSVRASQVVSPSELPDSPGNTMPPSPSRATKSTQPAAFFGPDAAPVKTQDESSEQAVDSNDVNASSVLTGTADTTAQTVQPLLSSDVSSPINYCSEGGNMSSRTSLSALTCDGEHIQLCKEPSNLPLGEEETGADVSATTAEPRPNDNIDENDDIDDDGVDSPVNEDDEKKLAECISLGMPPKRRKGSSRMLPRSRSDGDCLRRQSDLPSSSAANPITASASCNEIDTVIKRPELSGAEQPASDPYDFDSPLKFATEDTPRQFSQSGSLSDLSSVGGGVTTERTHEVAASATVTKLDTTATQDDDSDMSLSDDDVPGGDELLSHLIEAAMPKKRQHWKPVVQSNNIRGRPPVGGPPTTDGVRRPVSRSLEPPTHRASRNNPPQLREFHGLRNHQMDSRRQHNLPGKNTPNTVPHRSTMAADQQQLHDSTFRSGTPSVKPQTFTWADEPAEDHLRSYAVEGTPDSYSRERSPPKSRKNPNTAVASHSALSKTGEASWNSSLSSLSMDSSLNAEPTPEESALLQECINAALPKSRGKKSGGKKSTNQYYHQPLRTSPSGSSESSLKRRPANATSTRTSDSKTDPDITEEAKPQELTVSDGPSAVADGGVEMDDLSGDIMLESLPDSGLLDVALDDESLPSGPSTEANNTVIYLGPALPEAIQSCLTASATDSTDVTAPAELEENASEPGENAVKNIVSDQSKETTRNTGSSDLSPDQVSVP